MDSVAIFGANGFVGKKIYEGLLATGKYQVTPVTRDNYADSVGKFYNIVINSAMPGARFDQVSANELHFRCPGEALYGNFTMNLASARGLELLHETMAPHAVAGVLEELQARMCPRQVGYIAIDDAYSPALIDYIVREVPRLMAGLGNHAAALIVPCIGETEKAHLVTYRPTFDREFRNAVGMVTA